MSASVSEEEEDEEDSDCEMELADREIRARVAARRWGRTGGAAEADGRGGGEDMGRGGGEAVVSAARGRCSGGSSMLFLSA